MTHKRIKSSVRINILLVLVLLFTGIGALAFSTEVLSFENIGNQILAGQNVFIGDEEKPDNDATAENKNENGDDEKSLGGLNGKLFYGQALRETSDYRGRNASIFTKDPLLSATAVPLNGENDFDPVLSPDGKKIVFVSLRDGKEVGNNQYEEHREIYIMNVDGTSQRRLTFNNAPEAHPSFSADGSKIVYIGTAKPNGSYGYTKLMTMNVDGSNQTIVTEDSYGSTDRCYDVRINHRNIQKKESSESSDIFSPDYWEYQTPQFSADASKIFFSRYDQLFAINPDGSGCELLYETTRGYHLDPRMSPDRTKIATFMVDWDPNTGASLVGIRILDTSGNVLNTIFTTDDISSTPVWSPDGTKLAFITFDYNNTRKYKIQTINIDGTGQTVVVDPVLENGKVIFSNFSWGIPSTIPPPISLTINEPHPVSGGVSTTGTVTLDPSLVSPGGATVLLSVADGSTALSLPQTSVVVPAGQTQATFTIDTAAAANYTSGDIIAQIGAETTRATVSIKPSGADLSAFTFNVDPDITPGTSFNTNWVVKNVGISSTLMTGKDRVLFSLDNQLDAGDVQIATRTYSSGFSLAPGATVNTNLTVYLSPDLVPQEGTYYLILDVNYDRGAEEIGNYTNNVAVRQFQAHMPDWVPENFVAPANAEPNEQYTFSWTVRNNGSIASNCCPTSAVYFSTDEIAGNEDDIFIVRSNYYSAIQPGQTAPGIVYGKIPTLPVRPSGASFFYVKVDDTNGVLEGSPTGQGEMNNFAFSPTNFTYAVPDLQVISTTAPADVDSDTEFPFNWTTKNAGTKAASFADNVYFSLDNQVSEDDQLLGSFPLSLNADQTAERIQDVTIPTNAITQTGNYFLYVKTDGNSQVDEGENEDNNIRFQPVFVRRLLRPDLVVSNITIPNQAFFDQTINVQWTVTNNGQGPTNVPQWTDQIRLGDSDNIATSQHIKDVLSLTSLNPGESSILSVPVKIPRGYAGNFYFFIKTDSYSVVNEEDRTNNVLSRQIQFNVPPLPDLIVTNVQSPAQAFAGQPVEFTYTVANQGTGGSTGSNYRRDQVYLSRDTILDGSDRLIFTSDEKGGINPNGTQTLTTQKLIVRSNPPAYYPLTLPRDLSGEYYVFVVADAYDSVYEYTNENNNSNYDRTQPGSPINILITPPDLVVENQPTAPASGISGQSFQVGFTVKNQAAFAASSNSSVGWYDAVYLSDDETFDENDVRIGVKNRETFLAAGAEYLTEFNVRLPDCLTEGQKYLIAVTDYSNQVAEFDPKFNAEENNASPAKAIQVTTVPPDLQVTGLQTSAITQPGQTVTVNYTVSNNGIGAANGNWNDRIILYSNTPGIVPVQIGYVQHEGGLAVGANYSVSKNVGLPQYMQGAYYLAVYTDYSNTVPECGTSEENNQRNGSPFSVQNNLPDLVIDSVTSPPTAVVGDTFNINYTGRNANGNMPANSPSWSDAVYLSTDANYSFDDISIGSASNQTPLTTGQTYQRQVTVRTGNIPAGNYYVLVFADRNNNIYEGVGNPSPETNNVNFAVPMTLTIPEIDLQVTNVTVGTPTYSGTSVNVGWTVQNFGMTATLGDNWTDYIILSRDSVYDPTDKVIGYRSRTSTLAGNASYTTNGSFPIPNGLTGAYNIFVITDFSNRIIENNNNNNTSAPFLVNLELPPPADLNITNITNSPTAILGESISVSWTVQNSGPNAVLGQWRDSVYLSTDTFWDAGDKLIHQRDNDSQYTTVGVNETYTKTFNGSFAGVEEGTYYVIVRTDAQNRIRESNESNNLLSSAGLTTVTIRELQINTPLNTQIENGAMNFYKFTPPLFETMVLSLDGEPGNSNELLTNFGAPVSRADYDFQGNRPGESDQENLISPTLDGQYNTQVSHDFVPGVFRDKFKKSPEEKKTDENSTDAPRPPQNITLEAKILPFSVRSVSPSEAGNEGHSMLIIRGAKYQEGATVKLVAADSSELLPTQSAVKTDVISAIFDLKGAAIGNYTVVVTNPDNETTSLENGFRVIQGGGGYKLRSSVIGPSGIRSSSLGSSIRATVSIKNDGKNDAIAVPFFIVLPANTDYTLDQSNYLEPKAEKLPSPYTPETVPLHFDQDGLRIIVLYAPIVRAGRTVDVGINVRINGETLIQAIPLPPLYEPGFESLGSRPGDLVLSPQLSPTAKKCWIDITKKIFLEVLGRALGADCVAGVLKTLLAAADVSVDYITGDAFNTEVDPYSSMAGIILTGLDAVYDCVGELIVPLKIVKIGWDVYQALKLLQECLDYPIAKLIVKVFYSVDPNDKVSPDGYGAEHFVPIRQPMLYRINFENVAEANAPAQKIFVSDQLPPSLDPRTVRLVEIGFKQNKILVPNNQAFYQSRIQLGADLNNLQADISAGLDVVNRRVTWTITAIDPNTGEQTLNPTYGILPPNNENRDGEGYVTFTIEPTATMPTRTDIGNFATIIFDENEPIVTNTTANLLDSGIPTSQIAALTNTTSDTPDITLNWTGADDANGSGLGGFELLYSEDDNPYVPFIGETLDFSGVFNGKWGKSYRFYSVAKDNAGNNELPPDTPDATVTVRGGDTEGDVSPRPDGNDGQLSVEDLIQIRRFAGGLDTTFQFNEFQRADISPRDGGGDGAITIEDIIQSRRFTAGLDPKADADGPNEAATTPFAPKVFAKDNQLLPPREIRPVRVSRTGNKLTVGIELEAQGDEVGIGFTLNFNTAHLSNPSNVQLGSGASGAGLTVNDSQAAQGRLGILLDKSPTQPIPAGLQQLITIEFDVAPGAPATTDLSFGNTPIFSQVVSGAPATLTTNFAPQTISLAAPTAAGVSVAGRVLANNSGVTQAYVDLTDELGIRWVTQTSLDGSYRFDDVEAGRTYTISVRSRRYQFQPRVVNVTDEIVGLNLTAVE